jgi:Fe-S-cluster containining protein
MLRELCAKVDAFFAEVARELPAPTGITCHAGCDDCCRQRLSVTRIEAEAIADRIFAMAPEGREALGAAVRRGADDVCAALVDGRCAIYEVRPLICRTHGLPIRYVQGEDEMLRRRLPVVVDACPRNFTGHDLQSLPRGVFLDQATLSTVLGALDAANGAIRERGKRVDLGELLVRCTSR